jgi:hypothetical protein
MAPESERAATGEAARAFLLYEAAGEAEVVARALRISLADAQQRCLRGGFRLGPALPVAEAESERARLLGLGLGALTLPEEQVLRAIRRRVALRGDPRAGVFSVEGAAAPVHVGSGDPLLVVRGPIAREYQPTTERQRIRTATLEQGYLIHIHLRSEVRPIEIDPATFIDQGRVDPYRSTLLRLIEDVGRLCSGAPVDTGFEREPPALAVPEPSDTTARAATFGLKASRKEAAVVLDNKVQFRFYSAWHASLERARCG